MYFLCLIPTFTSAANPVSHRKSQSKTEVRVAICARSERTVKEKQSCYEVLIIRRTERGGGIIIIIVQKRMFIDNCTYIGYRSGVTFLKLV